MNVSNRHDSSSLLRITDRQTRVFPGTQSAGTESVRMVTLDSAIDLNLVQAPALMKIDVQGFELEVLKGARQVLRRCEYVYAEVSFEELYEGQALAPEVIAFLDGEGFGIRSECTMSSTMRTAMQFSATCCSEPEKFVPQKRTSM